MRTIGIDCRFSASDSGLGRYTRELVTHLLRRNDPLQYVLFVRSQKEPWQHSLRSATNYKLQTTNFPHYSVAEQLRMPSYIRTSGVDLYFSPHFNVPVACPVPFVLTMHDLILHRYPNRAPLLRRLGYRLLMRLALARAARIISVSHFTAQEILHVYGSRLQHKVVTVHEGVSQHFAPRPGGEIELLRIKYGLDRSFFLYVGNAKEHKNVPLLLEAFRRSGRGDRDLILVTGGREAATLKLPPHARVIPAIVESDLPALYTAADAFVTASLYEGFGLPVLEALACGCPVIAVRQGALPELAGGSIHFVPNDVDALASALQSPALHRAPIRQFSWEATAEKTAAVLTSTE